MLDQEKLYQHIFKENWTELLEILYSHKNEIATDQMLSQATTVFESEFFSKLPAYEISRKDIEDNLDTLYLLHHGHFYKIKEANYKSLNLELIKRKPPELAIDYARHFPNEEISKQLILKMEAREKTEDIVKISPPKKRIMNWVAIYNRLFELINEQGKETYYSGPRFIETIREHISFFPNYAQYIDQRNKEGKSTSRKIFYYDILMSMPEDVRLKAVHQILGTLGAADKEKVKGVNELLQKEPAVKEQVVVQKEEKKSSDNPIVFISYSWDDEAHKSWVLSLADRLCSDGIDVILDRYVLNPGKNLIHFIEESISKANRVIIVFTPNYKLKADKRAGGVGYEYSIMNVDLYKNQTTNEKIIPMLRAGSTQDSIPTFMQQYIHLDLRNDENFENSYNDLVREIYSEPAIQKPALGVKPKFEKIVADKIVKPEIGKKPQLKSEVTGFINPLIVAKIKNNDTPILTLLDGTTINAGTIRIEDNHLVHYTGKGLREMWKPNMNEEESKLAKELQSQSEEYLVENNYISWTPLDQIIDINR